jgi:hypothetical protein
VDLQTSRRMREAVEGTLLVVEREGHPDTDINLKDR